MKSLSKLRRCGVAVALGSLMFLSGEAAALATGNRAVPLDLAFTNGLAALKAGTGFIESRLGPPQTQWQPNLQVLVGVKAIEGAKQTIRFVELTTLRPAPTNSASPPWTAPLRTNKWSWSSGDQPTATNRSAEYISPVYPVRVRVFDEAGSALTEGVTALPWGLLTNGLVDLCRISLALNRNPAYPNGEFARGTMRTNADVAVAAPLRLRKSRHPLESKVGTANLKPVAPSAESPAPPPTDAGDQESDDPPQKYRENDDLMRSVGGGFLWMMTMFDQLRTVPAVRGIWEKVRYAVRLPTVWTVATSLLKGRLELSLRPLFAEVALAESTAVIETAPHYRLPVQMNFGKQNLARLDIIVGPANGAEMLLAGIKFIRAVHPDRPDQELTAQVLATGTVHETD